MLDQMERAISRLIERPDHEVASWSFLANTHQADLGIPTPTGALWRQCAHGLLVFLPWHRAYLHWFESIVRAEIGGAEGASWALPFWDYDSSTVATARELPPEFRVPTRTVDGQIVANHLYTSRRAPAMNDSVSPGAVPIASASTVEALANVRFAEADPEAGFGGSLSMRRLFGDLESKPHNDVHMAFTPGAMDHPFTAAQDPIFWLHHSNIDRLWEVWRHSPWAVELPDDPNVPARTVTGWRSAEFSFGYATGADVYTMAELEDTESERLGYTYGEQGTMSDELTEAVRTRQASVRGGPMGANDAGPPRRQWAATGEAARVEIADDGATLEIGDPTARRLDGPPPDSLLIALQGLQADTPAPRYAVGVQAGEAAPLHLAGTFATFGISVGDEPPTVSIDASAVVRDLVEDGWDGGALIIRLLPLGGAEDVAPPGRALTVDAVTVYTA